MKQLYAQEKLPTFREMGPFMVISMYEVIRVARISVIPSQTMDKCHQREHLHTR